MTESELFEKFPSLSRTEDREDEHKKEVKSYALRAQRLKPYQIEALEKYYDEYVIVYNGKITDFEEIFGNSNPVVIEIGFGMGEITEKIALENPDVNYIGIEVFLYGFSKLLSRTGRLGLKNVRLVRFDAVAFLQNMVREGSVQGFNIFFPDPWQKKRHHKRRLIQEPFVSLLSSRLVKGGFIYCITDWEDYAEQMLEVFGGVSSLENPYENAGGYAPLDGLRSTTGFERKGLEKGHIIREIRVIRK